MYALAVQNAKGERLVLTNNGRYDVLEVTGITPPVSAINTVALAGVDGSRFNSSRIEQRNIVITLNIKPPIEENRIELYRYFQVKHFIRVYYENGSRNVFIDGYVESFEANLFAQLQQPQISIICPDPFWKSVSDTFTEFSESRALFEFPFSISSEGAEFSQLIKLTTAYINTGDTPTGGIIEFYAENTVVNPKIFNNTTGEFFGVGTEMSMGDRIVINTNTGEKSVMLYRRDTVTNILSDRTEGSKWIGFAAGENEISYSADEGMENLEVKVTVVRKYAGV